MHTFSDIKDRTWTLNLTVDAVKRVRALLDIDLLDPLGTGESDKPEGDGKSEESPQPLVVRLQLDLILLIDVIFAILKPEADSKGVTDEQFGAALGGDAAYDAFQAFMSEWHDFFQKLCRETEAKAIQVNMDLLAAEDKRNLAIVDQVTETAAAMAAKERTRAMGKIKALGRSETVTNSPESPESIPAD